MFRTLIIEEGQSIRIRNHVLLVSAGDKEIPVPVSDVYCIVMDNPRCVSTHAALVEVAQSGGHIVFCNEKHMPAAVLYPEVIHYCPYQVVKEQLEMQEVTKNRLWDEVVKAKLANQAIVLEQCSGHTLVPERIRELAEEVVNGDEGNREGIGAKLYFRNLFGSDFIRMNDDGINHAMNYGYAILRSGVVKTLYTFGYYPPLGIHHIGNTNPFNLGDDLMEPLRPLIDLWVSLHHQELDINLTSLQRRHIISLFNLPVTYEGSKMRVRNIIARYIRSFTTAIRQKDITKFKPPYLTGEVYKDLCHVL